MRHRQCRLSLACERSRLPRRVVHGSAGPAGRVGSRFCQILTGRVAGRVEGRVGSNLLSAIAGQVGSGQRFAGRVWSRKSDPWTTLLLRAGEAVALHMGTAVSFHFEESY